MSSEFKSKNTFESKTSGSNQSKSPYSNRDQSSYKERLRCKSQIRASCDSDNEENTKLEISFKRRDISTSINNLILKKKLKMQKTLFSTKKKDQNYKQSQEKTNQTHEKKEKARNGFFSNQNSIIEESAYSIKENQVQMQKTNSFNQKQTLVRVASKQEMRFQAQNQTQQVSSYNKKYKQGTNKFLIKSKANQKSSNPFINFV